MQPYFLAQAASSSRTDLGDYARNPPTLLSDVIYLDY